MELEKMIAEKLMEDLVIDFDPKAMIRELVQNAIKKVDMKKVAESIEVTIVNVVEDGEWLYDSHSEVNGLLNEYAIKYLKEKLEA